MDPSFSTFTQLVLALIVFFFLSTAQAEVDLCHSDPRQVVHEKNCIPTHNFIHISRLPGNPYHALQDFIWAAAHYISQCKSSTSSVVLSEPLGNLNLCGADDVTLQKQASSSPAWGVCLMYAITTYLGLPLLSTHEHPHTRITEDRMPTEKFCPRHTILAAGVPNAKGTGIEFRHYRQLSYFTRACGPNHDCRGVTFVPLSMKYQQLAFQLMRASSYYITKVPPSRVPDSVVRILLYDRSDAPRRKWVNAGETLKALQSMPNVQVRYIRKHPNTFGEQTRLYAWADVVIEPHGASLANSAFMRPGAEIVEVVMDCQRWRRRPLALLQGWTGWHAPLLGLGVSYAPCEIVKGQVAPNVYGMTKNNGKMMWGMRFQYDRTTSKEEILQLVQPAVNRVRARIEAESHRGWRRLGATRLSMSGFRGFVRKMEWEVLLGLCVFFVIVIVITGGRMCLRRFSGRKS